MLLCILRRQQAPLRLRPGLREIHSDRLSAIVSDVDLERVRGADRPMLQDYAETVAALHREVDLIPMRFGCLAVSDDAVRRLLAGRHEHLAHTLDHVDGCVELGLRIVLPAAGAAAAGPADGPRDHRPGHAHLAAVRRRLQDEVWLAAAAKGIRAAVEGAAAGLFRDTREELGQIGERHLLSLYYLVPRDATQAFLEALRHAPDPIPAPSQGHYLVSGPWPPYNFVGAIDDDLRCLA